MKENLLSYRPMIRNKLLIIISTLILFCFSSAMLPPASVTVQAAENSMELSAAALESPPVSIDSPNFLPIAPIPVDFSNPIPIFLDNREEKWFYLTAPIDGNYSFTLSDNNSDENFTPDDIRIELYDSNQIILSSDTNDHYNSPAVVRGTLVQDETYYIRTYFNDPVGGGVSLKLSAELPLAVSARPIDFDNPIPLHLGTREEMWFYFIVPQNGEYGFNLSDNNSMENFGPNDIHIKLCDHNLKALTSDSNDDRNDTAAVSGILTEGKLFYISVYFSDPLGDGVSLKLSASRPATISSELLDLYNPLRLRINPREEKWFHLTAPIDGSYSFTLRDNNGDENYGPNDIHLTLYDNYHIAMSSDSNDDRNSSATVRGSLKKGDEYYIRAYFSDPFGGYVDLMLTAQINPNAQSIMFGNQSNHMLASKESIIYKFTAPVTGEYSFMTNPESASSDYMANSLECILYDSKVVLIQSKRNVNNNGKIELKHRLNADETIYIKLYNHAEQAVSTGVLIDYVNNSYENARSLDMNESATIEIESADSARYFRFIPETTDWYNFNSYTNADTYAQKAPATTDYNSGGQSNDNQPILELRDARQALLVRGTDQVTDLLIAGETYYIVAGYSDQQTGSFELVASSTYSTWTTGVAYTARQIIKYGTKPDGSPVLYTVLQAHTSAGHWNPVSAVSLYKKINIPHWTQPLGSTDSYSAGDQVLYNGLVWISDIDNNVWAPGTAGWSVYEDN